MAQRSLYFSARSVESSPNNANEIAEVEGDVGVESPHTPLRPRRILASEESATSSGNGASTPNSPLYLRRTEAGADVLNMEDVAEDANEDGDGNSKASAAEMENLETSATEAAND